MRQIKFRGKRINNGEWVYGYYYADRAEHYIVFRNEDDDLHYELIDPETVGQFTGLRDKNDNPIYEGDKVTWGHLEGWSHERETRIGVVKYNPDLQFDVQNITVPNVFRFGNFAYRDTNKFLEIIGNIHEE